jgi:type VI secretion system protein ImpF
MAEQIVRERLQPSLLDRLTDDEPGKAVEGRDRRVISLDRLRECVLRDLSWLLNTGRLEQLQSLEEYPEVAHSVLNYGSLDLSGRLLSSSDIHELEGAVRQAIWDYEPRILRDTLRVRTVIDTEAMGSNSITFEIEGSLWAQPMPMRMFMHTEIDLETGHVEVVEKLGSL